MAPLFTLPPTCISWSPTGRYSTLASSLRETCYCATSNLPLGVTNEESFKSHHQLWLIFMVLLRVLIEQFSLLGSWTLISLMLRIGSSWGTLITSEQLTTEI